jgi:hypothetical protein
MVWESISAGARFYTPVQASIGAHLALRLKKEESYTSTPPLDPHGFIFFTIGGKVKAFINQ